MTSIGINHTYQFFPWKGKTIYQISAGVKRNSLTKNNSNILSKNAFFHALPLNIYRKEIATTTNGFSAGSRSSIKLRDFEMPGGVLNTDISCNYFDLVNTLELNIPNNKSETPGTSPCNRDAKCYSQVTNALSRVRRSGIVKHNYFASSEQYLAGRNLTYKQNQFNYIRQGNPNIKPGTPMAVQNAYSTQGVTSCNKSGNSYVASFYKPNNSQFATQGAVSSSSRIARLKYNTITDTAYKYTAAYGTSTANALAYGVPDGGYTLKSRMGYPNKQTPVFPKYSNKHNCNTCKLIPPV